MSVGSRPLLISGGRVIDPASGTDGPGDVLIIGGAVEAVGAGLSAPDGAETIDASGKVVAPGFVDLHCHLREPGFEDRETIETGTAAAAAGGFTTVCAMPNTDPPMDSAAAIEYLARAAAQRGSVRVLPIGCITKRSEGRELADMGEMAEAGAVGFSDDGHPVSDDGLLRQALAYASALGLPVIEHCETLSLSAGGPVNEGWIATRLGVRGVPAAAEEQMAARDIAIAELTGGWVHIAHMSTEGTAELVRRARGRGVRVTAEVTPHHLVLTERAVLGPGERSEFGPLTAEAYDTSAKVNPPLRTGRDAEAMVRALADGTADAVATDHAPHAATDKLCTLDEAAFGISGLETALGATMALVRSGALPLPRLIEALTAGPARLLAGRAPEGLGTLAQGAPGDVAVIDPDARWVVDPDAFKSKGRNTPLAGAELTGRVVATVFAGRVVHGP